MNKTTIVNYVILPLLFGYCISSFLTDLCHKNCIIELQEIALIAIKQQATELQDYDNIMAKEPEVE